MSHVAVYRYKYDARSMVLSSFKRNIHGYFYDFKTCTISLKINARQQIVVLYKQLSVRTHQTDTCESALTVVRYYTGKRCKGKDYRLHDPTFL